MIVRPRAPPACPPRRTRCRSEVLLGRKSALPLHRVFGRLRVIRVDCAFAKGVHGDSASEDREKTTCWSHQRAIAKSASAAPEQNVGGVACCDNVTVQSAGSYGPMQTSWIFRLAARAFGGIIAPIVYCVTSSLLVLRSLPDPGPYLLRSISSASLSLGARPHCLRSILVQMESIPAMLRGETFWSQHPLVRARPPPL